MEQIGHNLSVEMLRSYVSRLEKLDEEKAAVAADIKDVYAEAKANGYPTKELRIIIRERKIDASERAERDAILDRFRVALGMAPELDEEDAA